MSKEIKQNLFKFVTVRNPQLIDKKEGHPGFVFHPNEAESLFFQAINGTTSGRLGAPLIAQTNKEKLEEAANGFLAFKTRKEVAAINESLYAFSAWLMRNKNSLSFQAIQDNLNGTILLDKDAKEDIRFWDNLIYQTLTKQSVYVREALIQMLIANQFVNAFKDGSLLVRDGKFTKAQQEEFTRRACASVVLSSSLFDAETQTTETPVKVSPEAEKQLEKTTAATLAKLETAGYKTLLEELKFVEIDHKKSSKASYNAALDVHNAEVKRLLDEAVLVTVTETNPETGVVTTRETYPKLNLPKFNFSTSSIIYDSYLKSKLSSASYGLVKKAQLDRYNTLDEVRKAIGEVIKKNTKIILENTTKTAKKISVGGTVISSVAPSVNTANYYITLIGSQAEQDAVLSFNVLGNENTPTTIQCDATLGDGSVLSITDLNVMSNTNDFITIKLLEAANLSVGSTVEFTGTITFDSGITYGFTKTMEVKRGNVTGMFSIESTDSGSNTNDTTSLVNGVAFGVTSLGIADFRRVEQEVCCYVAGEVSHIENVMAREYKERETRSLTSIENTSEDTTESETEKLTDTTTTERNEMQSEVASVLTEDESSSNGANANVSYTPKVLGGGSINTGAFSDSASSSSTSNSNSQAQTYAQEVTERAMERIVRKVSKKRTSRILREFEENNTHGFDNRKGDKHITGVYRWIDKIYKNKLINYGKRLMYEFAIPEPAKFFKEAIYKKAEDNTLDTGVILPTKPMHPSEFDLHSAADLAVVDYQPIAAVYNAEVTALQPETIKLSKAFKLAFQDNNKQEGSSIDDGVEIPEGYEAVRYSVDGSMFHHGNLGDNEARIGIAIGGQQSHDFYQERVISMPEAPLENIRNEVAVSASTYDVMTASFNVYVECSRTDDAEATWRDVTFKAIMDAYKDSVEEYNAQVALNTGEDGTKLKFNPAFNRSLEKKELKRVAIELLSKPKGHEVSLNNYDTEAISKVKRNGTFQTHASTVKFFEQAFDWDIMAYTFYPYFYAEEADWKDLFQEQDAADPLFQAFLQSGMARTIVPVRPGFEDAVNWYMITGEIWDGQGLITDQENDLFVSIAEEMQVIEGEVEGIWETRLPTNLTIIQAGSIGLNVEGLPCNINCEANLLFDSDGNPVLDENGDPIVDNPIEQTNVLIGGDSTDTTTSEPTQAEIDAAAQAEADAEAASQAEEQANP